MKKFIILPLTVIFSFFVFSCEPEEMELNPKTEVDNNVRVYSETGDQADTDPTKKGG